MAINLILGSSLAQLFRFINGLGRSFCILKRFVAYLHIVTVQHCVWFAVWSINHLTRLVQIGSNFGKLFKYFLLAAELKRYNGMKMLVYCYTYIPQLCNQICSNKYLLQNVIVQPDEICFYLLSALTTIIFLVSNTKQITDLVFLYFKYFNKYIHHSIHLHKHPSKFARNHGRYFATRVYTPG